jgi:hypothetical protein
VIGGPKGGAAKLGLKLNNPINKMCRMGYSASSPKQIGHDGASAGGSSRINYSTKFLCVDLSFPTPTFPI